MTLNELAVELLVAGLFLSVIWSTWRLSRRYTLKDAIKFGEFEFNGKTYIVVLENKFSQVPLSKKRVPIENSKIP